MSKVTQLPVAADLTGWEETIIIQDGAVKRGQLDRTSVAAIAAYLFQDARTMRDKLAALKRGAAPAIALAARIRNSGWVLEIDVAEADQGGDFDPTKIALTVFDKGFDEHGAPTIRARVIEATRALRRPSPNQAQGYETIAAGVATWRLSLAEQVFAKAKRNANGQAGNSGFDPMLTLDAGWYSVGGTPGGDQDGLTVINNSTESYPLPVFRNALPPHRLLGATAILECTGNSVLSTEGRTVAAARCDLTGQTSGITRSQTVAQMIASDYFPQRTNASPVYRAEIATTDFIQGERVIERWRIFPFIGDEPFDTAGKAYLSGQFCNFEHTVDHAGTFPKVFAVVDKTGGDDGTGAASTVSEAAAAAAPFATDKAAIQAAHALNISAHGRDSQAGIEICFSDETHTLSLVKSVAGDPPAFFGAEDIPVDGTWCIYRPVTGAANCIIARDPASNARTLPRRTCLRGFKGLDMVSVTTGAAILIDGGEIDGTYGQELWVDNSPFTEPTHGLAAVSYGLYRCGLVYLTNCAQPANLNQRALVPGNVRQELMLCRDSDFASTGSWPSPWCAIGVSATFAGNLSHSETALNNLNRILPWDKIVMAGLTIRSDSLTAFPMSISAATGVAGLNILIETFGGTSQGSAFFSGDGQNVRCSNYFLDYLTIVGGRMNIGYEDTFTMADDGDPEQQLKKLMMVRRSVIREANTKTDIFQNNGARIHTWNVAHRTGWKYVRFLETSSDTSDAPGNGEWIGEAWPSSLAFIGPDARSAFVSYQANHRSPAVNGAGNGDYTPAPGSPLLGIIPEDDRACSVDLIGNARAGEVGALAIAP